MVEKLPSVSIIIPTLNCAKTIGSTLQSLLSLNYPKDLYEVIIVDGGSTDDTLTEATKYWVKVLAEKGASANRARNLGVSASKGEVLVFTDGDCKIPSDWLVKIIHNLENGFDCVGGRVKAANLHSFLPRYLDSSFFNPFPTFSKFSIINDLKPFNYLATCNMAIKRQAFLGVRGFDEGFRGGYDDHEFLARVLKAGYKAAYDPRIVVYHYHRERLGDALNQVYWYGKGLARFTFKHPKLKLVNMLLLGVTALIAWLTFTLTSLIYFLLTGVNLYLYISLLMITMGYASLTAGYILKTRGVITALTYPILDLLRSIAFTIGAIKGFFEAISISNFKSVKHTGQIPSYKITNHRVVVSLAGSTHINKGYVTTPLFSSEAFIKSFVRPQGLNHAIGLLPSTV
ncbi:MAG: glycosyltransferase [Candidatus Nezhaarchaeales archaeon]